MKQFQWKSLARRVIVAIGVLVVAVCAVVIFLILPPFPKHFDPKTWRTCESPSERYAMHQDFLNHHKVIGMTKEQLIDLLGPPNGDEKGVLTWNLGVAAGADDNYLEFQLRDGKVVSFRVWGV